MYYEVAQTPFLTGTITAGDSLGGLMTFTIAGAGHPEKRTLLKHVLVQDDDNQAINSELWLFRQAPTGTASGAAFGVLDSDLDNLIGVVSLPSGSYFHDADSAFGEVLDINLPMVLDPDGRAIYGHLVARGTYSIGTGTALKVRLGLVD